MQVIFSKEHNECHRQTDRVIYDDSFLSVTKTQKLAELTLQSLKKKEELTTIFTKQRWHKHCR